MFLTNPNDNLSNYKLARYVFKRRYKQLIFDMPSFANLRHIQKYATEFEH